jgi:predicted nuclease of predicted toxin-antitoxin system
MLRLLFDVNFNHRIVRGLKSRVQDLDFVVAQYAGLDETPDPSLLAWAADEERVLVTHDVSTMPKWAYGRVEVGQPLKGVIVVPEGLAVGRAIEDLVIFVLCSEPGEFANQVVYLPL